MKLLADDLWQVRGFPPDAINVYFSDDTLFDAATKHAGRRIRRELGDRAVATVALTHCHPDHQGVAKLICDTKGATLACHEDDVDSMEGRAPVQRANPDHPLNRLSRRFFTGPAHPVGRVLHEGDTVAGFRVVHAPGHTPGHVIYFRESDRVAIAGDVIANMNVLTGMPGVHFTPKAYNLDRAEARRSARKLLELEPALICVGHGRPLRDLTKLTRFVERNGI